MTLAKEYFNRVFLRDRQVLIASVISAALLLINWGVMLFKGLSLRGDTFLPLHYNIYFGIDLIGPWYGIFAPALLGLGILLLNSAMVLFAYDKLRFFAHAYVVGTPVIQIILLAASFFILSFNL